MKEIPSIKYHKYTGWIALGLSLIFTFWLYSVKRNDSEKLAKANFQYSVSDIEGTLSQRMIAYRQILRGGAGLFYASGNSVTQKMWRTYYERLNISENYPGIQGIGFTKYIRPHEKDAFERKIRSEISPYFKVWPEGDRSVYTSIIYLEPFSGRNLRAFGYDMFSEPVRHEAMLKARNSGRTSLTGKVTLVQETNEKVQAGFLMYLPIYNRQMPLSTPEERERAIWGFVYSPFRMDDLMQGMLGADIKNIRLKIYDGDSLQKDALMYDSDSSYKNSSHFNIERKVNFAGRTWTLQISSLPEFETSIDRGNSLIIILAGVMISLLLFYIIRSYSAAHQRALELAREVKEREKTEVELKMTLRELARSNKELEEFAYVASHDLQEPLRMVSSYTQLLKKRYSDKLDENAEQFLTYASEGAKRMQQLIHDLLQYSRVSTRGKPFRPIDINIILDIVQKNLQLIIKETNARITYNDLPVILADDTQMTQVFQNLINNALKFRGQEPPEIVISASIKDGYWVFSVKDNGIGIDSAYKDRIFILFQRLHERSEYPGTGIGLAVCKKIIERHGGEIWVESELSHGSNFFFTIPKQNIDDHVH